MCSLSSGHLLGQTAKCSSESRNSSTNSLNQDGEINIYIFHRFYHRMLFTSPSITNLCKYTEILHEKGQKTECIVTRSQKSPESVSKGVENHNHMCPGPLSIPQKSQESVFFPSLKSQESVSIHPKPQEGLPEGISTRPRPTEHPALFLPHHHLLSLHCGRLHCSWCHPCTDI